MQLIVVGLNYKTAPVEIRERLSFQETHLEDGMLELNDSKSILENVIISTCNRTEVYAVVEQLHTGKQEIKQFLEDWFQIRKESFEPYLYIYENDELVKHLFRVTCGLDSMILGETQILGQVKLSFLRAQKIGVTNTIFNQLFKDAVTVAKKAHSETEIADHPVSVSYAAVELAKKIFGNLSNKKVLVIGAGKMGELALKNLQSSGASDITIMNRTYETALKVAEKFAAHACTFDEFEKRLFDADIVISSTGAKDYIITKPLVEKLVKLNNQKPMFFVDIAVPRDIDPRINEFSSVFLYDIDDLEGIVEANISERERAAIQIEEMVEDATLNFNKWFNTLDVVPLIASLREKAFTIQKQTMDSLEKKLPDLSEREKKVIGKHMKSIVNQLLKDPIVQIKELASKPNGEDALNCFKHIFDLKQGEDEWIKQPVKDHHRKQDVASTEFMTRKHFL
ncbi:glutamyl-tRNA reductase [Fervidibacillus halotolerans]|uniref:Glutamyl-tRNA reductase n=1 Tax=Fervidibacillus halotolerans TaxID=2980027 RepID=A0A9E8M2J4_9BACI|nr:glutamyl-tRNA reductase [Fervidibacillus halotolerans]WAA13942.1 glutamyl-tRNA reductase [Fervidibacillus halotolerans]